MEPAAPYIAPTPADAPAFQAAEPGFDYRGFLHRMLTYSWVIVLCLLLGLGLGLTYLYRTPKLFQSRSVLEVDVAADTMGVGVPVGPMSLQGLDQLRTIEQNLRNRSLMERVVRAEDLVDNKDFLPPSEDGRPYGAESLAGALGGMVNPVIRRGTRLIDLAVVHTNPQLAQRLADAVGREYIKGSIAKHIGTAQMSLDFLRGEAETLRKKVAVDEADIQKYQEKNGAAINPNGGSPATQKLNDLTQRLTQARTEHVRMQTDASLIEANRDNPERLLTIPSVANRVSVTELRNQATNLGNQIDGLAQRYGDKNPKMIAARTQLAGLRKTLRDEVLRQPALLKSDFDNAGTNEKNLQDAVAAQEKEVLKAKGSEIPFNELQRTLGADKVEYETVLKRVNEFDITKGIQADPVAVVEKASFSSAPISPLPIRTLIFTALAGLALGLGIVTLIHLLDRTIKTVDQAEHYLGLPVLAAVPDMKLPAEKSYLLMIKEPNSTAAEAFRSLRASLALLGPENERKVLLFTSAIPSEGKSFSSTNYSVSLAQQGHRTLLIDADLRRPAIHKIFGMDRTLPGVTDYLVGNATLEAAAHSCEIEDLFVMPGGQKAPNPAELLSSHTFGELVAEAAKSFDRVVIDSAPVMAVSDTLIITPYIQSLCLVVRSDHTARNVVRRAITLLEQAGNGPVGLVLNRLPRRTGVGYYYYYSEHGYGGAVYGAPDEADERASRKNQAAGSAAARPLRGAGRVEKNGR